MKTKVFSYINRNYLLFCKMFATALVSTIQSITFLLIAKLYGVDISYIAILFTVPAIIVSSITLNAFALFLSSVIKQLENFATVMNFVIFPMLFLSSALYPLWRIKDSSLLLFNISSFNPFTYIVEFIRFSLYLKIDYNVLIIVLVSFFISLSMAFIGFKSKKINRS